MSRWNGISVFECKRNIRTIAQRRAPYISAMVLLPIFIVLLLTAFFTNAPKLLDAAFWLPIATVIFAPGVIFLVALIRDLFAEGEIRLFVESGFVGLSVPAQLRKFSTFLLIEIIHTNAVNNDHQPLSNLLRILSNNQQHARIRLGSFRLYRGDIAHILKAVEPQRQAPEKISYTIVQRNGSVYKIGVSLMLEKSLEEFVACCKNQGIEIKEKVVLPKEHKDDSWNVVKRKKQASQSSKAADINRFTKRRTNNRPKENIDNLAYRVQWTPVNDGYSTNIKSIQRELKEFDDKFAIVSSTTARKVNTTALAATFICTFILAPGLFFSGSVSTGIILAAVAGSIFGMVLYMRHQDNSFTMEKSNGNYYFGRNTVSSNQDWEKYGCTSDIRAIQLLKKKPPNFSSKTKSVSVVYYELNLVLSGQRRIHILELCDKQSTEEVASTLSAHFDIPVWKLSEYGEPGSVSEMAA